MYVQHTLVISLTLLGISRGQEVETKCGKLKGVTVDGYEGKKVNKFLGVPYAEPPIGPLRFRDPAPKKPWTDVRDASKSGAMCPQIDPENFKASAMAGAKEKGIDTSAVQKQAEKEMAELKITGGALAIGMEFKKFSAEEMKGSEDCLFLNIFTPADAKPDSKLPVMMFFHGGLFYAGAIGIPSFDGSILASAQNVVVMAVQFRMGVYGFLHGATKEIPGNQGLRDQMEAMRWAKDNIAAFGGDPELITIFGSNSGGWSAGFHLISPMAKGLFKRVIMESGSSLAPLMLFGEAAARTRFEKFVKNAGCPLPAKKEKDPFAAPTAETYECLGKLTRAQVDEAQAKILTSKKDIGFLPSEDTTKDICYFCANPFDIVKDGNFPAFPDVMMGTNSDEGGMFLSNGLREIYPPFKGDPKPYDLNMLVEHAKKSGAGSNAGQMQMMLPMFFRGVNKKDPVAVRNRLLELISDGMFVCPDLLLVNSYVKKGKIYYYRFDYRPTKTYWNKWLEGSLHMDEHQFVWGIPFRPDAKENYSDQDRTVSKTAMAIWATFAKTGNPQVEKKWKWKACKGKDRGYLVINAKGAKGMKGFPQNSCKDLTRYYAMGRSFLKNYKPS